MKIFLSHIFLIVALFVAGQGNDDAAYIRNNYAKMEATIAMRDGVKLYTAIYSPKDTSVTYPILMERTPYSCSPYGENNLPKYLGPNSDLMRAKYIFVYQDVR